MLGNYLCGRIWVINFMYSNMYNKAKSSKQHLQTSKELKSASLLFQPYLKSNMTRCWDRRYISKIIKPLSLNYYRNLCDASLELGA